MAVTSSADMKIIQPEVQLGYAERVAQNLRVLTERANGAIIVTDAASPGEYLKADWWKLPSSAVTRRKNSGTGYDQAVTPISLSQAQDADVKLCRKVGPFEITQDALRKIGTSKDGLSYVLGQQIADVVLQMELNDALLCVRGAVLKTATTYDQSALTSKTCKRASLVGALKKFGDQQQQIVCWVGHSKVYGDLMDEANTATAGADAVLSQVAIMGGNVPTMGRPFLMTDSSSLILDETADKYFTFGLVSGAIRIKLDTQLSEVFMQTVLGKENIMNVIQTERDWFIGIKGYTWDVSNGGANPLDAALLTSTNWDLTSTDVKSSAGVVVKST